ncbi:hypothetical protein [Humisphaera borealis]|uniref:Uncharacterized protein n=1 Tax=Humisphaera borealis TaxID=2807512 RepID=A0A7M2WRA4_9BACT|nr:hypothetical protein [Humisphaera borealis]QOV87341.1 hypothetical protein IPV69_13680 [Humisphaera borealis]
MESHDEKIPIHLNYAAGPNRRRRCDSLEFFGTHLLGALMGLFVFEPITAMWLFGRRGDQGVMLFVFASVIVSAIVAFVLYQSFLWHRSPALVRSVAALTGFANFVPAYVVLLMFFYE